MRLGFVGKGGAGKSSMSAAFTLWSRTAFKRVLAVDADINRHLERKLAIPFAAHELGTDFEAIARYLEPNHPLLRAMKTVPELGTLPVTPFSRLLTLQGDEDFWNRYSTQNGNVRLARVGTYEEEDFGTACIHVKLKGIELLLHRLRDAAEDVCILDLTAGTDPLSTSLAYALDLHVLIAEPTKKSVAVVSDYLATAGELRDRVGVILNKITDEHDLTFLREQLDPAVKVLGVVGVDPDLRRTEQGDRAAFQQFVQRNCEVWEGVVQHAKVLGRNEHAERQAVEKLFRAACSKWACEFYDCALDTMIPETSAHETGDAVESVRAH